MVFVSSRSPIAPSGLPSTYGRVLACSKLELELRWPRFPAGCARRRPCAPVPWRGTARVGRQCAPSSRSPRKDFGWSELRRTVARRQLRLHRPRHRGGLQGHHLHGDRCVVSKWIWSCWSTVRWIVHVGNLLGSCCHPCYFACRSCRLEVTGDELSNLSVFVIF